MSTHLHLNTALNYLAKLADLGNVRGRTSDELRTHESVARLIHEALRESHAERGEIVRTLHSDVVDAVQRYWPNDDPPVDLIGELTHLCHVPREFTLRQLQDEQRPWVAHNFKNREPWHPLLGAVEEVGELAHAHLKAAQGIRGTAEEHHAEAVDAVADVVIYLADYCSAVGIDFQAAVEHTWRRVSKRDWKADPVSGGESEVQS